MLKPFNPSIIPHSNFLSRLIRLPCHEMVRAKALIIYHAS
jgi:hypothetical protein